MMTKKTRRKIDAALKAKIAPEAVREQATVAVDMLNRESIKKLIAKTVESFGSLDMMFNSLGWRETHADCWRDRGAFQASPFDGDLAEMGAAGLVTEGVGQLIEGEAAVQDRTYPRLFERSDIILLLAPAADHKSLQARLLGQQFDGRHKRWRASRPAQQTAL
jgi:NAD(P)-dependent dehydrogenase (short-subunit alcohol dehydrogenase family)